MNVQKIKNVSFSIGVAIYCFMLSVVPVFADGPDTTQIEQAITGGLQKVYSIITAIVLPIAIIAFAVCAVKMVSGDAKAGEAAKATAIKIAIGLAIVYLAPFLVTTIAGWFRGTGSQTINGVTF